MSRVSVRKVRMLGWLLVVITVAYFLITACNVLFFEKLVVASENAAPAVRMSFSQESAPFSSFAGIEQRNLLKVKNQAPVLPAESEHVLFSGASAVSQRGFALLGTILGSSTAQHYAIVLVNNKQSLYKVGQAVAGWTLLAVKRREILLERNGVKERLLIDTSSNGTGNSGNAEYVVARSSLKKEFADLQSLTRSIQLSPRKIGGVTGLQVSFLRSSSFFYSMGIRKGDMLVEVNGRALVSFRDSMALLRMLDEKMIALDIVRKGKRQTLTYRLVN